MADYKMKMIGVPFDIHHRIRMVAAKLNVKIYQAVIEGLKLLEEKEDMILIDTALGEAVINQRTVMIDTPLGEEIVNQRTVLVDTMFTDKDEESD